MPEKQDDVVRLEDQYCQNCRFWVTSVDYGRIAGECCKNPPVLISDKRSSDGIEGLAIWPKTRAYSWCGAWEERPADSE